MPKGTRVSRCVDKVKRSKDEGAAIAICQSSTNQGYASGKKLRESLRRLYRIDELLPALAARLTTGTAQLAKKKLLDAARKRARDKVIASAQGVATGGDTTKKQAELGQQAASDKDLEENKMNNAYVRRLMEDEPTKKEAQKAVKDVKSTAVEGETKPQTIEFEKSLRKKTPKKKYFGGATTPEDVDTKAAKAALEAGIKGAGKAAVKKGDEADEKEISRRVQSAEQQNAWTEYHRIGKIIAETEFPKGPTAQRYASRGRARSTGTGRGAAGIKDPLVRREVATSQANIERRLRTKTNPKVSDLVQASMNRRRAARRGLPQETPAEAKADAQRDKWRRMAPGDK